MYCATHALVGGMTAGMLSGPFGAFAGGMVTHIILDAIPHHDYEETIWGIIDFLVALGLVLFLYNRFPAAPQFFLGSLGGTVPDLEVVINHLSGADLPKLFPSHSGLTPHRRLAWPWGFWIQVSLAALVFLYQSNGA